MNSGASASISFNHSSYRQLLVQRRGHILSIKFNRPTVKNALNRVAYFELIRALHAATHEAQITLIVLSGAGDCFTAGNDLTQAQQYSDVSEFFRNANFVVRSLVKAFLNCHKVIVAMVHGACLGVGFTLCGLCDVVYCTEDAYFQAPFTRLGICPELCSSYLFPQILGRSKASEALLFGSKLTAKQAYEFNFVAQVYRNAVEMEAQLWPQLIERSALPAKALKSGKQLLWQAERDALLQAMHAECNELDKLRYTDVHLNALAAFTSRRTTHAKSNL